MFNSFKNDKVKNRSTQKSGEQRISMNFNQNSNDDSVLGQAGVSVFYPKSFDDVAEIIDLLTMRRQIVVNLKDVKDNTTQRVVDILWGAVYALKGAMHEIEKNIFVVTPDGLTVK